MSAKLYLISVKMVCASTHWVLTDVFVIKDTRPISLVFSASVSFCDYLAMVIL